MAKKSNTKEFIEKSKKVHGDKYDYSEVVYINNCTKVKIKMTPNQIVLMAVYQTMYLNELVCCCVHDVKPSISKMDKETQKIFKAALKRVQAYEKEMIKIAGPTSNVYVDYNDIMDDTIQPLLDKYRDAVYSHFNSIKNVEYPYICSLIELCRSMTKFSIMEISNRIRDCLKYDEDSVSLRRYKQTDLLGILDNLTKWIFRKVEEDINLNDSSECVEAWKNLINAINNPDVIAMAIVKAQELNENESKD